MRIGEVLPLDETTVAPKSYQKYLSGVIFP